MILDLMMMIFKYEFDRFGRLEERQRKLKKRCERKPELLKKLEEDTRKINSLISSQNQIFNMCLQILKRTNFLVDAEYQIDMEEGGTDMSSEKIQKYLKTFSQYLVKTLDRNDNFLINTSFQMLDEIFEDEIPKAVMDQHMALRMERFFSKKVYMYPYIVLARLF